MSFLQSAFCYSQKGNLEGMLVLKDVENRESVIANTKIILKNSTRTDTVSIDKNLNFIFENVVAGACYIYIVPRSYPHNVKYKISFDPANTKILELPYSSTCPYKQEKSECPVCGSMDKVIPVRYGLIAEIIPKKGNGETTDYKSGGCVVTGCDPHWYCERDDIKF